VVRFLAGNGNFSLHYLVQNGSGAHSASYLIGNAGPFHRDKAVNSSSTQVNTATRFSSVTLYVFFLWCLIRTTLPPSSFLLLRGAGRSSCLCFQSFSARHCTTGSWPPKPLFH